MSNLGPQFTPGDSEWSFRSPPQEINAAIDSYPKRIAEGAGETQAPYDAASMAELYHPRVKRLMDLQAKGNTHAAWGRLNIGSTNDWYGITPDAPEIKNPAKTESAARKAAARYMN